MSELLQHAINTINRGWYIFPCKPRAKEPHGKLAPHGVKDASDSREQIEKWWSTEPEANIGVALGQSSLTVMDIDSGLADKEAALAWHNHQQLPDTYIVRTGRRTSFGIQYYFDGESPNRPFRYEGVSGEIRSTGYYVLGAGSIHPISGEAYEVLRDDGLALIPNLVFRLSNTKVPRPQGPVVKEELVPTGLRHYYLVARGRELHYAGLAGDGLVKALLWLYENRCVRDVAGDRGVGSGNAINIARWVQAHPPKYALSPRDFRALHFAEKADARLQLALTGNTTEFGSPESAVKYAVSSLTSQGCNYEQVLRILGAFPVAEMI